RSYRAWNCISYDGIFHAVNDGYIINLFNSSICDTNGWYFDGDDASNDGRFKCIATKINSSWYRYDKYDATNCSVPWYSNISDGDVFRRISLQSYSSTDSRS